MSKYACHAFHDELPNGRSSGVMEVGKDILTFVVADKRVHLPIDGAAVSMGGANNRLLFFSHPQHPNWQFYVSDKNILKDSGLLRHAAIAKILTGVRRHRSRAWATLAIVAAFVIALPLFLLLRMDFVTAVVAKKIPAEWETSLGQSALAQFEIGKGKVPSESIEPLLRPLVSHLEQALSSSRYAFNFHVIDDSSVNAFALPGGEVVIHSALILKAESPEELLGVIAHEMMHVEHQHGVRNILGTAGIYMTMGAIAGDVSGILALLSGAAPLLLNQSYSRRFEKESDTKGFELLLRAKIDPGGLQTFFEKLKSIEEEQLSVIEDEKTKDIVQDAMSYLSTHPATDERIANLAHLMEKIVIEDGSIDLSREFIVLQNAVRAFTQKTDSKSAANEK